MIELLVPYIYEKDQTIIMPIAEWDSKKFVCIVFNITENGDKHRIKHINKYFFTDYYIKLNPDDIVFNKIKSDIIKYGHLFSYAIPNKLCNLMKNYNKLRMTYQLLDGHFQYDIKSQEFIKKKRQYS